MAAIQKKMIGLKVQIKEKKDFAEKLTAAEHGVGVVPHSGAMATTDEGVPSLYPPPFPIAPKC